MGNFDAPTLMTEEMLLMSNLDDFNLRMRERIWKEKLGCVYKRCVQVGIVFYALRSTSGDNMLAR